MKQLPLSAGHFTWWHFGTRAAGGRSTVSSIRSRMAIPPMPRGTGGPRDLANMRADREGDPDRVAVPARDVENIAAQRLFEAGVAISPS